MSEAVHIPVELALRAVRRQAGTAVEIIEPGDVRRTALVHLMGAAREIVGYGWTTDEARARVSVTLPGFGTGGVAILGGLSRGIPVVGDLLAEFVVKNLAKTAMFFSPAAVAEGITLSATFKHEEAHAGWIAKGGVPFCIAYLIAPEVRGATESACFVTNMAHEVILRGTNVIDARNAAKARLVSYGLDDKALDHALKNLESGTLSLVRAESVRRHRGWKAALAYDPTGTVRETVEALNAEGWNDGRNE